MRATVRRWREDARFSLERQAAPHVEAEWAEAVLLELRLQGVRGDRIGEVLAEVDAHCVDSGLPAADAFGDPVAYARSLELPAEEDLSPRGLVGVVVPGALQVLGMLATVWGVGAWADGEPLSFTVGLLASLAIVLALAVSLVWTADAVLRAVVHRPLLAVLGVVVVPFGVMVGLPLLLDHEVVAVPAPWVTLLGAGLVAVVQVHEVRQRRQGRGSSLEDPVVLPLGGPVQPSGRAVAALSVVTTWQMPVLTVVLAGLTWWLTSMS